MRLNVGNAKEKRNSYVDRTKSDATPYRCGGSMRSRNATATASLEGNIARHISRKRRLPVVQKEARPPQKMAACMICFMLCMSAKR